MVTAFLVTVYGIGGAVLLFMGGQALIDYFKKKNDL